MSEVIGFYMRLSSEDDEIGESCSIQNQRDLLYEFVRTREEWNGCRIMEFCDDGYSGMHFRRPGIQALLSFAGNPITCIIVKDFSRFGRNLVEVGNYLDQIFPVLGVRFIAVNEKYDSRDNRGSSVSLEVSLKAMLGELYSRDISEKIRCVQKVKMQKGEYLCAIAFYGYQRSQTQKNKLIVDKPAAQIVHRIFSMAAKGMTPSEIAVQLNQEGVKSPLMYRRENQTDGIRGWNTAGAVTYWTRENVKRILSDERYTGCLISHKRTKLDPASNQTKAIPKAEWITAENTQEAIVSKELFLQAQKYILRNRKNAVTKKKTRQQLKYNKLVKCACCKRVLQQSRGKERYFFCPTKKSVPDIPCREIRLKEKDLESVLFYSLQVQIQLMGQSVFIERNQKERKYLQEAMKQCQKKITRCKTMQAVMLEEYAEGRICQQDYMVRKKEVIRQREELKNQYEMLSKQEVSLQKEKIDGIEFRREQGVQFEEWIEKILVNQTGSIEIIWKFKEWDTDRD